MKMHKLVLTLFLTFSILPRLGDASPTITIGSATVNLHDTFTIPFSITGAVNLTSWRFDLTFDPTILQVTATGVTESPFFTQGDVTVFIPGAVDNTLGQILGAADALILQPAVSGSGILANIEFFAVGAGVSPLTLSNVSLNQSNSGFAVSNGSVCVNAPPDLVSRTAAATCEPSPVPEPGMLALLAVGLLAWGARPRALGQRSSAAQRCLGADAIWGEG
jgi:hypothetical protein